MTEAQFEYKCRRCGEVYRNPCCSEATARDIMYEVLMHGTGGSIEKGGRVRMLHPHACKDGGEGLADLQGYRVKEVG